MPDIDPQCAAKCKEQQTVCLREGRGARRGGEDPAAVRKRCMDQYTTCMAGCGREKPPLGKELACIGNKCVEVPKGEGTSNCAGKKVGDTCGVEQKVLACVEVPGAQGRGTCYMVPKNRTTDAKIALCAGKKEGDFCGGTIKKEYLRCDQRVCNKVMLTEQEAKNYAGSIARCNGLNEGDKCGGIGELACQNGKCVKVEEGQGDAACQGKKEGDDCGELKHLACIDGKCKFVEISTPEAKSACTGKKEGDDCGKSQKCKNDDDCPPGYSCLSKATNKPCAGTCEDGYCFLFEPVEKLKCVDGKCVECEEGESPDDLCKNKKLGDPCGEPGEKCEGGYQYSNQKILNPACDEGFEVEYFDNETWCCPTGDGNGDGEEGGEFKWSEKLQGLIDMLAGKVPGLLDYESEDVLGKYRDLLDMITGRSKELMGYESEDVLGKLGHLIGPLEERIQYLYDYPRGLKPEERQGVINYALEGIKRGERGELQAMKERTARAGLLGSGYEEELARGIRRGTREDVARTRRELAIDELNRRFDELMGTTEMATAMTRLPVELQQWDATRRFNEMMGTTGLGAQIAQIPMGEEKWDATRKFQEMMATTGMGSDIINRLMTGEMGVEQLSGARRAEFLASMQMILNFLGGLEGTSGGQANTILQALLNQMGGGTVGYETQSSTWLPWLLYLIGGQIGG